VTIKANQEEKRNRTAKQKEKGGGKATYAANVTHLHLITGKRGKPTQKDQNGTLAANDKKKKEKEKDDFTFVEE